VSSLIYFSSVSENTRRFVERVGIPADRIPLRSCRDGALTASEPFVLVVPTYGGGTSGSSVPKQVVGFLNDENNRRLLRGVIASGNTNFGEAYCLAGRVIASRCRVPLLYRFELLGTSRDVQAVKEGLDRFWARQHSLRQIA
jgi:protein involved in ribonucleotide reduction